MIPGSLIWSMKATHGLPMNAVLDRIAREPDARIDWISLIDAAKRDGANLGVLARTLQSEIREAWINDKAHADIIVRDLCGAFMDYEMRGK